MIVETIKALADVLGCSHEAIRTWQSEGMPVLERGGGNKGSRFDTAAVHGWLLDRAVRKAVGETPRDRLARVQAEMIELDLAAKRKILIPAHLVEPYWHAAVVAAREMLQRSRRKLAREVANAKDDRQREQIIAKVHDAFLLTMSQWRRPEEDDRAQALKVAKAKAPQ